MTTTTTGLHHYGFDFDIWRAAMAEGSIPEDFDIGPVVLSLCECGVAYQDVEITPMPNLMGAEQFARLTEVGVRAALLAGWDGVSGCLAATVTDEAKAVLARLKAEGFGGPAR